MIHRTKSYLIFVKKNILNYININFIHPCPFAETCLPIPIQCAVCGKICNGRKSHSDHVRKHKQSLDFACNICGRKYPYEKDLIRHMKASHFDIRYGYFKKNNKDLYTRKF